LDDLNLDELLGVEAPQPSEARDGHDAAIKIQPGTRG